MQVIQIDINHPVQSLIRFYGIRTAQTVPEAHLIEECVKAFDIMDFFLPVEEIECHAQFAVAVPGQLTALFTGVAFIIFFSQNRLFPIIIYDHGIRSDDHRFAVIQSVHQARKSQHEITQRLQGHQVQPVLMIHVNIIIFQAQHKLFPVAVEGLFRIALNQFRFPFAVNARHRNQSNESSGITYLGKCIKVFEADVSLIKVKEHAVAVIPCQHRQIVVRLKFKTVSLSNISVGSNVPNHYLLPVIQVNIRQIRYSVHKIDRHFYGIIGISQIPGDRFACDTVSRIVAGYIPFARQAAVSHTGQDNHILVIL